MNQGHRKTLYSSDKSKETVNATHIFGRFGVMFSRLESHTRIVSTLLGCMAFAAALLAPASASAAVAPAPAWQIESVAQPTNFEPGDTSGHALYVVTATDAGALETNGEPIVMTDTLPAGMTAAGVEFFAQPFNEGIGGVNLAPYGVCTTVPLRCEFPGSFIEGFLGHPVHLQPNQKVQMVVHVEVGTIEGPVTNEAEVSGGGAQSVATTATNEITSTPTPVGVQESTYVSALDGSQYTQAGGRPYEVTTTANFNTEFAPFSNRFTPAENFASPEEVKDVKVNLPAGLIGNPLGVPRCSAAEFGLGQCPAGSQVGTITFGSAFIANGIVSLYNLIPGPGLAAEFGYRPPNVGLGQVISASVRTGGDYGQTTLSANLAMVGLRYVSFTLWGVPASPVHDRERGCETGNQLGCPEGGRSSEEEESPFLSMPSSCSSGPLVSSVTVDGWNLKENRTGSFELPPVDGCNQVHFAPTLEARPTTNLADSPSGLDVNIHVPQSQAAEGLATAHLRDADIALPEGIKLNPSAASGLLGCSEVQVDLHGAGNSTCPEASKLGAVELKTPLVDHPLKGSVYLASPNANPFGSLLAVYVVVDDSTSGVIIKLAGKVTANQQTGQLTASFEENPQQPFEDLKLSFFPGAQGILRTPATCGSYVSTSQLTPWSAPESGAPATPTDSFQIQFGPSGSSTCSHQVSEEPSSLRFHAGTEAPQAGVYSPFSLRLVREDGSQELSGFDATLPPGLTGRLVGIPYCSDVQIAAASHNSGATEKAKPSCPTASEVGTVDIAAGAGPTPYYVQGHAYLAGPYKGAPLSLEVITPAVAGPFDLGTVAVRAALFIDPETTQIHVVSDPIPSILQGIPLDLRSITLKASRPQFTLNPTSCNEMSFNGSALSVLNVSSALTQRFQVANCSALPFKPTLKISLKGGEKRTQSPALKAVLTNGVGGANIASAQVSLPHSELVDNAHIGAVCTRPQLAAEQCPAASVYGFAKAESPLLEKPLEGPVYLGAGYGHKLPDLVADLKGQITVILHGRIDSDKANGLRATFETVPDAPVSKFTLEMQGGKKSLLENSENICKRTQHATALFTGQNGKAVLQSPLLANSCRMKKGKKNHKRGAQHGTRTPR